MRLDKPLLGLLVMLGGAVTCVYATAPFLLVGAILIGIGYYGLGVRGWLRDRLKPTSRDSSTRS